MSLVIGKHCTVFFLLIMLIIGSLTKESADDVYQWVDANGVVHLSDNPPDISAVRRDTRVIKEDDAQREEISIPFERTPLRTHRRRRCIQ